MLKTFFRPHSIIVTILIFLFIWLINELLQLNMHFLDPFNNGLKEYEITDIVYASLTEFPLYEEEDVIVVNIGHPDRTRIAALAHKLHQAEASVIGIDVLFREYKGGVEDSVLQATFKQIPNLVLACELLNKDSNYRVFDGWVGVDTFFSNYGHLAYVNFPANESKTIRIFSPREQVNDDYMLSFAARIAQLHRPEMVQKLFDRKKANDRIYYIGNKDDFKRQEQDFIIDSLSLDEVRRIVKDKIVILGFMEEDIDANPLTDRHYTPLNSNYGGKSIPDMYGIIIHANVISMILNEHYISRLPTWLNYTIAILFCYLNVLLIHWIYKHFHEAFHGTTRALQVVEFILLFLVIGLLFYNYRLRLEFGIGILALLLAYDFIMIYESLLKKNIPILEKVPEHLDLRSLFGQLTSSSRTATQKPPQTQASNTFPDEITLHSKGEEE